jgi:putative ABC transport system permease protein
MLFGRKADDEDYDREITYHLEELIEANLVAGMNRDEARRRALLEFGREEQIRQQLREVHTSAVADLIKGNLRAAFRFLRSSPSFSLAVILTLALGIGATTAIFTLVQATLLHRLPYPEADRILNIGDVRLQGEPTAGLVGIPRFFDLQARSHSFESLGYFFFDDATLINGVDPPLVIRTVGVNDGFWKVFGEKPLLGRVFDEKDMSSGASTVVVLSYHSWQQNFHGDPKIIGRVIQLDQEQAGIVGVMPQSFQMPNGIDLWESSPFMLTVGNRNEGSRFLNVFGRLKQGVSLPSAQSELKAVGAQLQQQFPGTDAMWQFGSTPLRDYLYGDIRPALIALFLASGFLLLIACINVANLLLSRATVRTREVALRRALGASDGRILLQFLSESLLLSLLGGLSGLAAAFLLIRLLAAKLPHGFGEPITANISWSVIGASIALSFATGIIFGIVPVWQNRRVALNSTLKLGEARLAGAPGDRLRNAFIAMQVGLSFVLLIGASLLAQSLWNLTKSPLGFEPDNLLTFSISLPWNTKQAATLDFYGEIQRRLESLPGVIAVGQIDALPTVDWHLRSAFDADWLPRIANHPAMMAEDRHIAGNYLRAVGTPVLMGRSFTDADVKATPNRILVNQALVQRYLPDGNPIGRHLLYGSDAFEIIGVVGNVRGTAGSIANKVGPEVYWPADGTLGTLRRSFVVHSRVPPPQLIKQIREQVRQVDPQQALAHVSTMDDRLDRAIAQPRMNMELLSGFALIALLLACVGIYGVVAYSVVQRTQEIGVRMALGATRAGISLLFMRRAMLSAAIGLAGGVCVALFLSQMLRSELYGVAPNNPFLFFVAVLSLLIPVLLATLRPALAAASVNPVEALRGD